MKILKIAILLLLSENIIISMDNKYRPSDFDGTDLTTAIRTSNTFCAKQLINSGVDLNKKNNAGYTPLMLAGAYQNIEIIKLLIKKGANPDITNSYGCTALILQCETHCNEEIIKLLINAGTNIHINPKMADSSISRSFSALKTVFYRGNKDLIYLLLNAGGKIDSQYIYLEHIESIKLFDNFNIITKLIKSNINCFLNIKDTKNNNILHYAAKLNKPEIFIFILSLKPKLIAQKNKDGLNSIQINPGIVHYLFENISEEVFSISSSLVNQKNCNII